MGEASDMVATSAAVVFGLGFINSFIVNRPTNRVRLFIGVGILYIFLAVAAEFNEKLAKDFAILVMVTAVLSEGGGVLNYLMGHTANDTLNPLAGSTGTPEIPAISGMSVTPAVQASVPPNTSTGNNPRGTRI